MEITNSAQRSQSPLQDKPKSPQTGLNSFQLYHSRTSASLFTAQGMSQSRVNAIRNNQMTKSNFKTVTHYNYRGSVRKTPSMFASTPSLTLEKNGEHIPLSFANNTDLQLNYPPQNGIQKSKYIQNFNTFDADDQYLAKNNFMSQFDTQSNMKVSPTGVIQIEQHSVIPRISFKYDFVSDPLQRRQSFMQSTMDNLKYITSSLQRKSQRQIERRFRSISNNEVLEDHDNFSIKYVLKYSTDDTFAIDIVNNHFDEVINRQSNKGPDEGLEQIKAFLSKYPSTVREYINKIDEEIRLVKSSITIAPSPVKIPVSVPSIDKGDLDKVKNLRFEFSNGKYALKWDEPEGELTMERELEIIKNRRKPFVGGNWKSNGDMMFVDLFTNSVLNKIKFKNQKMEVMVAPAMIHIPTFNDMCTSQIQTGAQNVSKYDSGAFTGQVTGKMLKDMDCNWCIIGHSERRHIMKETDIDIGQKAKRALDDEMSAIICIGETMMENEMRQTKQVCSKMLQAIADEISAEQWQNVVIAYEPVWAIGTGKTPSPKQVNDIHADIRFWLSQNVSPEIAESTRIIYGGSVTAENCEPFIQEKEIDGFLVGGASMKPEFQDIVETVNQSLPDDGEKAKNQTL